MIHDRKRAAERRKGTRPRRYPMSILLTTSRRNDMRPLAFQGMLATNCYDQLSSLLKRHGDFLAAHGMPDAGSFLAEPVHDPRSGSIDWYTNLGGEARKLSELSEEEQRGVSATLARYGSAVRALLESQSEPGRSGIPAAGTELLRLAFQHPSALDDIYLIDGKPVLINWGFHPGAAGAAPEDIMRLGLVRETPAAQPEPAAAVPPVPPAGPAAAAARPAMTGCLGWLLPLFLGLLLLWLLLAALGWLPSPLPASCFRQDSPDTKAEDMRRDALQSREQQLLSDLRDRAAQCKPAPKEDLHAEREAVIPPEPPAVKPEEPKQPEKEEPKQEAPFLGAAPLVPEEPKAEKPKQEKPKAEKPKQEKPKPEVKTEPKPAPQPKAEPKPVPKPEPTPAPTPKPKHNAPMNIPPEAAKNNDVSFLEGCWTSVTNLFNNSGEPIVGEYCFNKRGQGRRFIREKNGKRCSGAVTARFNGGGGNLAIDSAEAHCPDGTTYVPQQVQCRGTGTSTKCDGQELGGRRNRWDAGFRRK